MNAIRFCTFILGVFIFNDPRKRSVKFGVIRTCLMCNNNNIWINRWPSHCNSATQVNLQFLVLRTELLVQQRWCGPAAGLCMAQLLLVTLTVSERNQPATPNCNQHYHRTIDQYAVYSSCGKVVAWRCHTHNSSQNVSLRPLHWAVIMGRVSTEPGNKMPLRSIG